MRSKDSTLNLKFSALGTLALALSLAGCVVGGTESAPGAASSPNVGQAGQAGTNALPGGGAGGVSAAIGGASNASGGSDTRNGGPPGVLTVPFARLTRVEYQATIKAAFGIDATVAGVAEDNRIGPFTSNVAVLPDPAGSYMLASEDLAALLVPSKIPACTAATATTCLPKNYQAPLEKLFRRALRADELTGLATMLANLEKAGVSSQDASRQLLSTALMGPDFLFRATPIAGTSARAQQLSEQLSYAFWDAPPDAELTTAVAGASADLGDRLRTQAMRLVKSPQAVTPVARFLAQWLQVDVDVSLGDPTYASSPIYQELLAFAQDALTNNVPVTSFVNGTHGFIQKDQFSAYGMAATASSANVVPVTWPATSPRRGIIGEELLMDATRTPDPTRRPIFRGKLVQASLLCNAIPPPPPELQALAGEVSDRVTDPRCKTCHSLMEPVGAAFASVDLDHTGTVPPAVLNGSVEIGGTYADLPALLDKIAKSQTYADCFSRNLLSFFLEQDLIKVDPGAVSDISAIVKSGGGFADAIAQLIVSLEARSKSVTPWCAGP